MNMDKEKAGTLKIAIKEIRESVHGQELMEFLGLICGKFGPNYNPESSTSITLAAGRAEVLATLLNLERLTDEQIVEYYTKGT